MLYAVTPLIHDLNAGVGGNQGVDEVDAQFRPVHVGKEIRWRPAPAGGMRAVALSWMAPIPDSYRGGGKRASDHGTGAGTPSTDRVTERIICRA